MKREKVVWLVGEGKLDFERRESELTAPVSSNSSSSRLTNAPLLDLALSSRLGKYIDRNCMMIRRPSVAKNE